MDKVIPNQLNYADLKPEAIDNEIKLIRFTPQSTGGIYRPGDTVKFMLQSNGFYDPYSAYLKFTVNVDKNAWPTVPGDQTDLDASQVTFAKFMDRSAHSFINRLVIRSQGVELERLEQYDILAAMINDVVYSPEQKVAHCYEGFPTAKCVSNKTLRQGQNLMKSNI